jgi:hypothetical protein
MKRAWCLILLLGAGCVNLPLLTGDAKPAKPAAAVKPARPIPPVTPEQVTEENAREKAQALSAELDREEQDAHVK